jgi:formate/nitrite transporter FocA (FNT family)
MAKVDGEKAKLHPEDEREVEEHQQLTALAVYEVIRREGKDELERPASSLLLSGITAGIGMGFSLAAKAALHAGLPVAPWRSLVENLGYSVGFVIVVLSRHQLFTENTLTGMLPVLHPPMGRHLLALVRLWSIVFVANMVGTAAFAGGLLIPGILPDELRTAALEVSRHSVGLSSVEVLWRAIPAGWIIATLVWMLPSAETAKVWIIVGLTSLISVLELTHVVAGATEAFLLVWARELGLQQTIFSFILPSLIGNIVGGSALFASLSFGQVKDELR